MAGGADPAVVIVHGGAELTSWPLARSDGPDLGEVDELARLALLARRAGCTMRLRDPGPVLLRLLDLAGLRQALGVEVRGQSEHLEQRGVEKVVVADDAVAGDLDDLDRPR